MPRHSYSIRIFSGLARKLATGFALFGLITVVHGQVTVSESFTGTTANGWVFGGNYTPILTAAAGIDTPGDGWLRLTDNAGNRATYALFDSSIFSVNAQVQIEFDYAFWNSTSTGADGITFFLVDGSINAASFDPGSYGGSLGYAQRTGDPGMVGGYLGFGLDNYGNFSSASEGRNGGLGTGLFPNRIAVRGPESSNYEFIAASAALNTLPGGGQMDFPTYTTRPDQTGVDYRSFRMTLDANNQLTVEMKFGASGSYITAFTADLSTYDRPDTFKIGFTGATGGVNEIHEIRNTKIVKTPWQPSAFEWDNGAGTTAWGATPGGTNSNWYHADSALDIKTPTVNADILFGNKPSTDQTVTLDVAAAKVNSLTFDAGINYTLNGTGSLLLGDILVAGLPSINVNDYNNAQGQHKINLPITLAEELRINNYSFSTLCLNGAITTGGNDIKVNGTGATNFNADINGSGSVIKNGSGLLTINSNNSDGLTPWTGNLIINQGMVVATVNGALGTTGGTTTVNTGGVLAFRDTTGSGLTYSTAESVTLNGRGVWRGGEGQTGALYNDGGNNSFAGNITLASASAIGSRDGVLTLSGVISGGNSLTKLGDGVVSLTGTNTYTGATIIEGGVLRVTTASLPGGYATGGPSGGNLQLAGGVLEIASNTNFTRRLGTADDQVQWTGDGGFSAFGGNRTVTLTNSAGTAGGQLTWNAGSFVPTGNALLLSSEYSNATVTLTNAINLGGGNREVRVANGSAAVDGVISGVISNGGLIKTGDGTLNISGANTYTGTTEIRGGALRGTISNNSNITLNGGVLELGANFSRNLGTGGTNVQWTGDGGFAAQGANRTVRINNSTNAVTWGSTANFVGANNQLILGSGSANRTLIFDSALNLGGGTRTIRMQDGSAAEDARLARVVSNGSLNVVGAGLLAATAVNTLAGTVTVEGAELHLNAGGRMASVSGFTVRAGGQLVLDNTGNNQADRVGDSTAVTLQGGTLGLLGRSNANSTETIGAVNVSSGANTLNINPGAANRSVVLTSSALNRTAGASINFTNTTGTLGTAGNNPRVIFTAAPAQTNGILAYATVNGTAFATHGANGIAAAAADYVSAFAATVNAGMDGTFGMGGDTNRFVNSLVFVNNGNLNMSDRNLDVVSGGILSNSTTGGAIAGNGTLFSSSNELIAHIYNSGVFTISTTVTDNGANPLSFIKSGDGVLALAGTTANTFTGITYVNDGTLVLAKSDGVNAIAGTIIVGDGRGLDILRLDANEQIANTANVTLRGSEYGTGETILQFNGTGGVGVTETFDTLTIDGHAIIDFAGGDVCNPNFLFLDDLLMASGNSQLYIRNWIDFTDFLLVRYTSDIDAVLNQIHFEGYGPVSYWQEYDADYARITPVPEPSTYGAMLIGAALAGFVYRRWKAKQAAQRA